MSILWPVWHSLVKSVLARSRRACSSLGRGVSECIVEPAVGRLARTALCLAFPVRAAQPESLARHLTFPQPLRQICSCGSSDQGLRRPALVLSPCRGRRLQRPMIGSGSATRNPTAQPVPLQAQPLRLKGSGLTAARHRRRASDYGRRAWPAPSLNDCGPSLPQGSALARFRSFAGRPTPCARRQAPLASI